MSCLLMLLVLSAPPEADAPANTDSRPSTALERPAAPVRSDAEEPRAFHEINRDLRNLIRRHARAKSDGEAAETTRRMCSLYRELKRDPRRDTSPTLQIYQAKLWSKLKQVQADLQRQLDQRERLGRPTPEPSPSQLASPAQQMARQRMARQRMARQASDSLADTMSLSGSTLGGPGQLLAHGGSFGGGAGPADLGPALVELIQRTISPEFWDVHGGPGTIVYFAPLRVLVVRATSEIHHRIGGAVGGLRRAGR